MHLGWNNWKNVLFGKCSTENVKFEKKKFLFGKCSIWKTV